MMCCFKNWNNSLINLLEDQQKIHWIINSSFQGWNILNMLWCRPHSLIWQTKSLHFGLLSWIMQGLWRHHIEKKSIIIIDNEKQTLDADLSKKGFCHFFTYYLHLFLFFIMRKFIYSDNSNNHLYVRRKWKTPITISQSLRWHEQHSTLDDSG